MIRIPTYNRGGWSKVRKMGIQVSCYILAVVFSATISLSQSNAAAIGDISPKEIPCEDVTKIDFKNLTIRVTRNRIFAFHNGIALNWDDLDDVTRDPDWEAEIRQDTTVHPTPDENVRFLMIQDTHIRGTGWRLYLIGYRCSNGKLQEVFHREGLSLGIDQLDSSEVTVGLNPIDNKPIRKHWQYVWDRDKSRYVVRSTWTTRLPWGGDPQ